MYLLIQCVAEYAYKKRGTTMACYHPIKGYQSKIINPSGKRSIVFNPSKGYIDRPVTVPCGQCIGCRLERSKMWAVRCVHEASLHEKNCFITLTYNDENLPPSGQLEVADYQNFMKRLRKEYGPGIRFFHCGEYGEQFKRPHYHACLFNFDFPDKQLWKEHRGNNYYTSQSLNELWGKGFCSISDLTFKSAAYVARYITKKVTGEKAVTHYETVNAYGEIYQRKAEYTTMSRRPGIAKGWFEKYYKDVYPDDFIVIDGKKYKTPRFYDGQFEILSPKELQFVKIQRKLNSKLHEANNTHERLAVRHEIQLHKFKQLKRSYENEP